MSQRSLQWHVIKSWADDLNSNAAWTAALDAALDQIGLDAAYIAEIAQTAPAARTKAVKDSVWGMIEVTPPICALLDCPLMQRLRFVRQLGFSYLTYPNANHSRFEHSIGTYWVVRRLLDSADRMEALDKESGATLVTAFSPTESLKALMSAAALLHDIGHGPFSHALESVVEHNLSNWTLGPFTAKQFTDKLADANIRINYGKDNRASVPSKNFCELFAAAIIVSPRFRALYSALPRATSVNVDNDVISIASLLLGTPIEKNQPGISHIISGPIDADKLDYIVRDAQSCGISISLDISRVLFRAGFYRLSDARHHPQASVLDFDTGPVEVFVIEQSGTDALRELAMSRLSLYSRVYYHQCTRNAEKIFSRALAFWSESGKHDFIDVWRMGDEELLGSLRRSPNSSRIAQKLWARRLPKRAIAITKDCYSHTDAPLEADLKAKIKKARKSAVDQCDQAVERFFTEGSDSAESAAVLATELEILQSILPSPQITHSDLEWHTVATPNHKDPTTNALCLSDDRTIEVAEPYLPQFVKSGEFSVSRRYLFCHISKKALFAIALQKIMSKRKFAFKVEHESGELVGLFCPSINLERSNQICKISKSDFHGIQLRLAQAGYYDDAPDLLPITEGVEQIERLAVPFSAFCGGFGWRVDATHMRRFLRQFPPKLRQSALSWLTLLEVDDWRAFAKKAAAGIENIRLTLRADTYWVVPLSFTSGTQVCKALTESARDRSDFKVDQELRAVLRSAKDSDAIIFVDDNIASGTQAIAAITALTGGPLDKPERSTYKVALDKSDLERLKRLHVAFVFAWGTTHGVDRLFKHCEGSGMKISAENVVFVSPLQDEHGRKQIDGELKEFLRRIGTQLVAYESRAEGESDSKVAYAIAEDRALGYGNAEGHLIGSYGIPSSTYTALFMPGKISYVVDRPWNDGEYSAAWFPLFLRSQKAHQLVVV